ncbi:uncharacterized protein METZ01_LOCUS440134 [marine metagenome]|uniref:Uncharacterized protein n=1 Tax=marine metagenome TaxID=408172 RepID=A0A382YVZ3_9ZZZZ
MHFKILWICGNIPMDSVMTSKNND